MRHTDRQHVGALLCAGELERPLQPASPAPLPAPSPPPAWRSPVPTASLRHIQSQEAAAAATAASRCPPEAVPTADDPDAEPAAGASAAIPLSQVLVPPWRHIHCPEPITLDPYSTLKATRAGGGGICGCARLPWNDQPVLLLLDACSTSSDDIQSRSSPDPDETVKQVSAVTPHL